MISSSASKFKSKRFVGRARKFKIKRVYQIVFTIKHVYNNFFVTASQSRKYGRVLFSYSGGFSKLRGNKRRSYRSAELVMNNFVIPAVSRFKYKYMYIYFTVSDSPITAHIVQGLSRKFNLSGIYEQRFTPHNTGPKVKKARRV